MQTDTFLFPHDLEVTPTGLKKGLFIGSCLAEAYLNYIAKADPSLHFDHILYNNAADLPARSNAELDGYDLQYIQLPLRSILTDAVIRIADKRPEPIDWLEEGKARLDVMLDKAMAYNRQAGLLSLVSTFFVPQNHVAPSLHEQRSANDLATIISRLNDHLAERVRNYPNAFLADVDMIANCLGKRYFLDDFITFFTHGSVHYPEWREDGRIEPVPNFIALHENHLAEFFAAVFRQMEWLYRAAKRIDQVKLVIFDLDNTMWRGQLAEQYQPGQAWPHAHGWPLGVWEATHHLRWRGIITAIASKNDHAVVAAKWHDAVEPPFVKFDDFLLPQIHWGSKVESVATILQGLSLTPQSAVFVDDHPVEREAVKAAFPGIRVIGSNPYLTRRILLWSAETQIQTQTQETLKRQDMMSRQIERERQRAIQSPEVFLAGLNLKLAMSQISEATHASFPRVEELVNKTNQFNTTGKRWDPKDYQAFWSDGGRIFSFSAADRFTDYGLVGVVFARRNEIVQFVMSCRVLGMEIELAALSAAIAHLRSQGAAGISATVIATESNTPCRDLFPRGQFRQIDAGRFELPQDVQPAMPPHIELKFVSGVAVRLSGS